MAESLKSAVARLLPDLYRAINGKRVSMARSHSELRSKVLRSARVRAAMDKVMRTTRASADQVEKDAVKMFNRLAANKREPFARVFWYLLCKLWKRIYHRIDVDKEGITHLAQVMEKHPVLVLPTHKSHIDYLVLDHAFFTEGITLPYIAAGDNLLIPLIGEGLRGCGAFFIRRSFNRDVLYTAMVEEYIHCLLDDRATIEFFIEGGRSRSGKVMHPKMGLLSFCLTALLEDRVSDIMIAPVIINYERVIEGETYSKELLGSKKKPESLKSLVKALDVLRYKFGSISVRFDEPFSMRDWVNRMTADRNARRSEQGGVYDPVNNRADRKNLVRMLGYHATYKFNEAAAILPTALVGTVLLTHGRGITRKELVNQVCWVRDQVTARGGRVAGFGPGTSEIAVVNNAVELMGKLVYTRKKGIVHPLLRPRDELQLGYFRNQIIHHFVPECIVACCMASFPELWTSPNRVSLAALDKRVGFLTRLLKLEFIYRTNDTFAKIFAGMLERGIVTSEPSPDPDVQDDMVGVGMEAQVFQFLCRLLWPFIDSYWVACASLFALLPNRLVKKQQLLKRMQVIGETLFYEGKLSFYESLNSETLANALSLFAALEVVAVLTVDGDGSRKNSMAVQLSGAYMQEEQLKLFFERIGQLRFTPRADVPGVVKQSSDGVKDRFFSRL